MNQSILKPILAAGSLALILLAGAFMIPWNYVNWGKFQVVPGSTLTVIGEATTQEKNQVATFTAGVDSISDNKDQAVDDVNQKITALTEAVKTFGLTNDDIQTQNLSIYRMEEQFFEEGRQKTRPGQWRVSNSITITLRDINRATELADLLATSGATNVYGPNFTLDDSRNGITVLLEQAIDDARSKAAALAAKSGRQLGGVISVSEGTTTPGVIPLYKGGMGAGGGGGMQPGSSTVTATVTVVFELK